MNLILGVRVFQTGFAGEGSSVEKISLLFSPAALERAWGCPDAFFWGLKRQFNYT